MSYITEQDFKSLTGIEMSSIELQSALNYGAQRIKDILFLKNSVVLAQPVNKVKLDTPLADVDGDGEVTVGDIEIYEFDKNDYVNPDTDLKDNVESFIAKYGYITLDGYYPQNGRNLIIDYYTARFDNETMKQYLPRLNLLFAVERLFSTLPFDKLQAGISSWNLNGVSVTFDLNSMERVRTSINKEIKSLYNMLAPIQFGTTKLGFDNDDIRLHRKNQLRSLRV